MSGYDLAIFRGPSVLRKKHETGSRFGVLMAFSLMYKVLDSSMTICESCGSLRDCRLAPRDLRHISVPLQRACVGEELKMS